MPSKTHFLLRPVRAATAATARTFAQTVAALSPAGFWRFSDTGGNLTNAGSVGSAGDGVPAGGTASIGGVSYLQSGILPRDNNKSIYLQGVSGSRIAVANHADFNTAVFSFGIAFRADFSGITKVLVMKDFANSWRLLVNASGQVRIDTISGANSLIGNNDPVQTGRWYYLWVTTDASHLTSLYLNGRLIAHGTLDLVNTYSGYTSWTFAESGGGPWIGCIDEAVWVKNRCLTQEDVLDLQAALNNPAIDLSAPRALSIVRSPTNALHRKMLSEISAACEWAYRWGVKIGFGEIGWPRSTHADYQSWNTLGGQALSLLDAYQVDAIGWNASERRNDDLNIFNPSGGFIAANAESYTSVWSLHPTTGQYVRGVSLSSGSLGGAPGPGGHLATGAWGNNAPGTLGTDYGYDSATSLNYLSGKVGVIRASFRHERMQTTLGAALVAGEVTGMTTMLTAAKAANIPVFIEPHNYGNYWLWNGSTTHNCQFMGTDAGFTVANFSDLLTRLASQFSTHMGLCAIELMNEPSNAVWTTGAAYEAVAQTLVDNLRAAGWTRKIVVPLGNYSKAQSLPAWHPRPFVKDPYDNIEYHVHHYWDAAQTGVYTNSTSEYTDSITQATTDGY